MSVSSISHKSSRLQVSHTLDILSPRQKAKLIGAPAQTYHCMRFGPSSGPGATLLSLRLNWPTFCMAAPMFLGSPAAICLRTMFASFGPLPFVLTMICSGPSRWTEPK